MADDRCWRLQQQKRGDRVYWTLIRGSAKDRDSISIGYATEDEAQRYLLGIEMSRMMWSELLRQAASVGMKPEAPSAADLRAPIHFPEPTKGALGDPIVTMFDPDHLLALVASADDKDAMRRRVLTALWHVGDRPEGDMPRFSDPEEVKRLIQKLDLPMNYGLMYLRDYVEQVWTPHRKAAASESWKREEGRWRRDLLPAFGHRRLVDLDKVSFDAFIQTLVKQDGTAAAGATKKLIRAAYQACLKYAESKGHIAEVHKFYEIQGATVPVYVSDTLTEDEFTELLGACLYPVHRCLIAVCIVEGLRPKEVGALDWAHVDLDARVLDMRTAGTKTAKSKAAIPLFPAAVAALHEWWLDCGKPTSGRVFMWNGKPMVSFKRALATAVKRAGITKRVTPYTLRHTFATAAIEGGAPVSQVAAMMRHSSPRMVEQRYDHSEVVRTVKPEAFPGWRR